jgi:hypothetical protein
MIIIIIIILIISLVIVHLRATSITHYNVEIKRFSGKHVNVESQ